MPARVSFDYAVLRVVPRVEREEFVNAGVVLFCPERNFLGVRIGVEEQRLRALHPSVDAGLVAERLEAFRKVAEGLADGGPIARLSKRERFHWIVSPRSTVIQVSPVHGGLCESPERGLDELFRQLVLVNVSGAESV
ncbi:MAG: DUF3037 domain-containing protein [Bryobacteraceae bacterium]|nr:DUF3037 domain-containing protein [Bryobacteraceae bacterium]